MMTTAALVAKIVAFLLSTANQEHTVATECSVKHEVQYCFYRGDTNSRHVVYFMHGFGNDIKGWSWNSVSDKFNKYWEAKSLTKPHVITVSFGSFWLYYEQEKATQNLNRFRRWAERNLVSPPRKRFLYGDSMGGHNALFWLNESHYLFDGAAFICPAISKSMTDMPDADYSGLRWLSPLADELFFNTKFNSQQELEKKLKNIAKSRRLAFLYLMATPRDELGFYPGNLYLKRIIDTLPFKNFYWETNVSRHCNIDPSGIATLFAG